MEIDQTEVGVRERWLRPGGQAFHLGRSQKWAETKLWYKIWKQKYPDHFKAVSAGRAGGGCASLSPAYELATRKEGKKVGA